MLKEQSSTNSERQELPKNKVFDPLEGIIEGNNRQERYSRFINEILVKIWPSDKQSGEYGEYNDDFYRSTRFFQGDISGYTQSSPFGVDPQFLSAEQFETAVSHLDTPDYVRVRSIPRQLFNSDSSIVAAGGSCAIETYGMRTVKEIQTGIKNGFYQQEYLTDFVQKLIDRSPTITHISGAILGGHSQAIHYIESDMWAKQVESFGVPKEKAYKIVDEAYKRINEAVARRAQLINQKAVIIPVNFDELSIKEAVEEWFNNLNLSFDPQYRIAEVIYTYNGPNQLNLLKKALSQKINTDHLSIEEKERAMIILESLYHVRAKQIDHLRWGSMKLPKEVITGQRELTHEEQRQFDTDYAYRMGIMIMKSVYEDHKNETATSLAVGFADLPSFGNEVAHESRNVGINFKGKPGDLQFAESVEAQLTSPARLNRHNIDEHLAFLRKYTEDNTNLRQLLIKKMNELQNRISPFITALKDAEKKLNKIFEKIAQYDNTIKAQNNIIEVVKFTTSVRQIKITNEIKETAVAIRISKEKALASIQNKPKDRLSELDKNDLVVSSELIEALKSVEKGEKQILSNQAQNILMEIEKFAQKQITQIAEQKNQKVAERQKAEQNLKEAQDNFNLFKEDQLKINKIKASLSAISNPNLFPLNNNPFIHHAMQFLWDPDFVFFMREAVNIQEQRSNKTIGKDESNEKMRVLMEKIYPKLETYINYLYDRIDYPFQIRNSRIMSD